MQNAEIIKLLNQHGILKNNIPKKNIKWFLNKPENSTIKAAIFENTPFVLDQEDTSIRERIYVMVENINELPKCEVCSTRVCFRKDGKYAGSYATFCSRQCISKGNSTKRKKTATTLKHYNVENPFQAKEIKAKTEKTMLKNHGVVHALQSKTIRDKMLDTMLNRYGIENARNSEKFNNKIKQTCLATYGVENPFQSDVIKEKIKNTCSIKYGVPHHTQQNIPSKSLSLLNNKEWLIEQHHTNQRTLSHIAIELQVSYTTISRYLHQFEIIIKNYKISMAEREIVQFIQETIPTVNIITNTKSVIPPYELDIYIPEYNLTIEYNGLFWHAEINGKTESYHVNKTNACEVNNIQLIHIFEDEWRDQQQQCKDTLKHYFGKSERGDFARNTTICEISWNDAKHFLNKYHLLKAGTSGIIE